MHLMAPPPIKKSAPELSLRRCEVLTYPDSNQDRQNQKLQCYHYTISQSLSTQRGVIPSKVSHKVTNSFSILQK